MSWFWGVGGAIVCAYPHNPSQCTYLARPLARSQQIIDVNSVLRQGLEKGLPITNLMENWDFLQASVCA